LKYSYHPKHGKVEDLHFLKAKGLEYLKQVYGVEDEFKLPKNHKGFFEDYQHRKMCISSHIHLRQNINEANFLFYHDYFTRKRKKTSRQRETATKIVLDNSYVIPDSIF